MLSRLIFVLIFVSLGALVCRTSLADTHAAASCSQANVASAISAASDGDVVTVPAGTCTWSPTISTNGKNITIQGAGIDQTIINSSGAPALTISSKPATLTGFTFNGTGGTFPPGVIYVNETGNSSLTGFRIHHNKFNTNSGYSINTRGLSYGVIDHNSFNTTVDHTLIWIDADGTASWSRPSSLGTSNNVFVEDNTFVNTAATGHSRATGSQRGARWVFRHNTVTNLALDAHGHCGDVGTFSWEIYDNSFTYQPGCSTARLVFLRGGNGVMFNNAWTVASQPTQSPPGHIRLFEYRINAIDSCSGAQATCCTSYPCFGQIGRTTSQALDPVYFWNNTVNGSPATAVVETWGSNTCPSPPSVADYIVQNRDFYMNVAKPGYTTYTYPHPLNSNSQNTLLAPTNLRIVQ